MIRVEDLKANSGGQPLLDHSRLVGRLAREMGRQAGLDEVLLRQVEFAGYAHDLGKAVSYFQDHLDGDGEESNALDKPRHHEISWAFLASRLSLGNHNEPIFNAIYWHHARPVDDKGDYCESRDAILVLITKADIKRVEALFDALRCSEGFDTRSEPQERDEPVPPLMFDDGALASNSNARVLAIRTCLIAADRCVSALTPAEFSALGKDENSLSDFVSNLIGECHACDPSVPPDYDKIRFDTQRECAARAASNRTTVVRAPAGFGKTIVGVLWGLALGRRMLWVCPRNAVAQAVFQNTKREVEALGLKLSMELHLSGERKEFIGEAADFGSDIIVTNIDTVLSPMVDNRKAGRLFTVLASAVVFDEFHEFASDQPLFAAFVTLMRARHNLCTKSKSLLLSATPSCLDVMWGDNSAFLPDQQNHYPPAHSGSYHVSITDDIPAPLPGSLSVVNSVSKCQELFRLQGFSHILHSRFTDSDRSLKMNAIFRDFGKGGTGVAEGRTAVSALVIQAAMDVSFQHLADSVCSPESTLQRIGRCDRWGTYQEAKPSILLACCTANNEDAAIRTVYDAKLSVLWREFLKAEIGAGRTLSLVEIYALYNRFCQIHRMEIVGYLKECYREGMKWLAEYAPVKFKGPAEEDATRRGRSLRNPFGSYFFSVRRTSGPWLGPDDLMDEGRELKNRFEQRDRQRLLLDGGNMRSCVKGLYDASFTRYRRYLKRTTLPGTLKHWFRLARSSETPLPDFTREYDSEIGLKERSRVT